MQHSLGARYREVWNTTAKNGYLSSEAIAGSRFYFEFQQQAGSSPVIPIPRRFDVFAILCGLPFPKPLLGILEDRWQDCLRSLGNPLAYGVEPANRHTEMFLFQRPEEVLGRSIVDAAIESSLRIAQGASSFKLIFAHPFVTPDGTIVVPGYDEPAGSAESLRTKLRDSLPIYPKKQSQWAHISLGRILEPVSEAGCRRLFQQMNDHWGEILGEVEISELIWVWEKQWYMVDREVLHRARLPRI